MASSSLSIKKRKETTSLVGNPTKEEAPKRSFLNRKLTVDLHLQACQMPLPPVHLSSEDQPSYAEQVAKHSHIDHIEEEAEVLLHRMAFAEDTER